MSTGRQVSRREFGLGATAGMVGVNVLTGHAEAAESAGSGTRIPLKIGHRAASMKMVGDFDVFRFAAEMPGLRGVELQVTGGDPNLRDWDAVRRYKREAYRWGMMIPSLAGVWDRGVSIMQTTEAAENLRQAVRVAEFLGASVALVAFFKDNAPDMSDEASYGPVVEMLQSVAPHAADAGVIFGLENSLSPTDNRKLVDLVGHPSVKVYYDPHNMAFYEHAAEAVPGFKLLGTERICQVHVKNGDKLLEDKEGLVDWTAAFEALNEIGYDGWYVFESQHSDKESVVEATNKNIAFMREHCRMPVA